MITVLTYNHTRSLFRGTQFLPFVKNYFKNVGYLGTESGNWYPKIEVSNWDEVKHELPKYAIPVRISKGSRL